MARRVFFSFHYDEDIWRVNQTSRGFRLRRSACEHYGGNDELKNGRGFSRLS